MVFSKLLTVLCSIMLLISLLLSITTLVILQSTISKTDAWIEKTTVLVGAAEGLLGSVAATPEQPPQEESKVPDDTDVDVLYERFLVKATDDDRIGIYSEDGKVIRIVNIRVTTLPAEARNALKEGVMFNSWRELAALIDEYDS